MTLKKKLLTAAVAGCVAVTSVPGMALSASAAKLDMSFDEDDLVAIELFEINGELNDDVIKVIEKASKMDYDDLTYYDLEKITSLDLSGLELEEIPGVVQYMFRLKTLDLSENRLRSADVNKLDMSHLYTLNSVDISDNYLTSVPSWFVSIDATKKDISDNLIGTTGQRSVELGSDTYYFMIGDTVDEAELKDKILSTLKLSDGTLLPDFFYDPELPTYDLPEDYDEDKEEWEDFERNTEVFVELDLGKYVDSKGKVTAVGSVNGEAGIYTVSGNANVVDEFKVFFLDPNDPTTVEVRLQTLINECNALKEADYTAASWKAYAAALKSAETLLTYEAADAEMIKAALDNLTNAKNDLIEGVSAETKKVLNNFLTIAKDFKEDDYSTASWKEFENAVIALQDAVDDPETSIVDANAAIKAYQKAQAGLTATLKSAPDMILKNQFEAIYGEDMTVRAKGVTRGGNKYSWEFNGNDITTPADFDPEISYDSKFEENIRFEVGSASDYQLISFAEDGVFPGTAVVTLDVSDVYTEGTYRLYKWNTSTKKSEFIKEVIIKDGEVEFTVDNGGDYFISSVLQNFQMISSNFDINHEKLTITGKFKKKYTVADFRTFIENGEALEILDAAGFTVTDSSYIATGMTAKAANSDVAYTIVVPGDCDGDGNITALDSVAILQAIVGEEVLTTYISKAAADVTGDGWLRVDDAVAILRHCIGME
ncbi:MAG: FIVAR domain-containing protein [Oscillospiraceae bacterium]|nr:FIVAR domain-containing protein [Oscillospiraceae bacterium]